MIFSRKKILILCGFLLICYQFLTSSWFLKKIIPDFIWQRCGVTEVQKISLSLFFRKITLQGIHLEKQIRNQHLKIEQANIKIGFNLFPLLQGTFSPRYLEISCAKMIGKDLQSNQLWHINQGFLNLAPIFSSGEGNLSVKVATLFLKSEAIHGKLTYQQIDLTSKILFREVSLSRTTDFSTWLPSSWQGNLTAVACQYEGKPFVFNISTQLPWPQEIVFKADLIDQETLSYEGEFLSLPSEEKKFYGTLTTSPLRKQGELHLFARYSAEWQKVFNLLDIPTYQSSLHFVITFQNNHISWSYQ